MYWQSNPTYLTWSFVTLGLISSRFVSLRSLGGEWHTGLQEWMEIEPIVTRIPGVFRKSIPCQVTKHYEFMSEFTKQTSFASAT